jgi:hypothetical protein
MRTLGIVCCQANILIQIDRLHIVFLFSSDMSFALLFNEEQITVNNICEKLLNCNIVDLSYGHL